MKGFAYISLACLVSVAPAGAITITVPGQQPTIQAGLNACSPGDTVLVAPGTYLENIVWPSTQGLYLKSEAGPEVTIIDGSNPAHPDTGSVIVFAPGLDESTVLEGFTITHGTGTHYPDFNSYGGGGILCDRTSPTIVGNVVTWNTERVDVGGGILCIYYCSPIIRGNTITNNRANATTWGLGGGIFCYVASATIADNIISENEGLWGCGVRLESSSSTVTGNEITSNTALIGDSYAGGVNLMDDLSTIMGNTISNNRAGRGGGLRLAYSYPTITDNEINDNYATYNGGGIQSGFDSAPIIMGNEIIGNVAGEGVGGGISYFFGLQEGAGIVGSWGVIDQRRDRSPDSAPYGHIAGNTISLNMGGGIRCAGGSPIIERCQISDNSGDGIVCVSGATPEVHFNDIAGHTPAYGLGNSQGPEVNAENNWWGDASGPTHPGNPGGLGDRVSDYVDYTPWSATSGIAGPALDVPHGQLLLAQNRPNPFNPTTEIAYSVPGRTLLSLRIYNVDGRMLRTLVDGVEEAGDHTVRWDGRDAFGASVPSGVYYYRLSGDGLEITRTMALVK